MKTIRVCVTCVTVETTLSRSVFESPVFAIYILVFWIMTPNSLVGC
jgi:hypothetical protein